MDTPEYLLIPDPTVDEDDAVTNGNSLYPDVSIAEFEANYQVTDVFQGKTRYMLQSALVFVNNQLPIRTETLAEELQPTYRLCVYAYAMWQICKRYGSIDTKTLSEYEREKKEKLALVYKDECRRLLLILNGVTCELT